MDKTQYEAVDQAAKASSASIQSYLESPSDRATRARALYDARNLVTELQDGDDAFFARMEQIGSAYALRFAMSIGAFQKVPREGSVSAKDLAMAVGSEESLIVRIFRLLSASAIFEEVNQDEYAHTRRSLNLLDPGYGYFFEWMMDEFYTKTWGQMPQYYEDHDLQSPNSPTHNPWSWAHGMEGEDWIKVMGRDPALMRKFAIAMSGRWSSVPATGIYPFEKELASLSKVAAEQARIFIVDVGGSQGGTMKDIREACPQLKGKIVVQDKAAVIDNIHPDYLPAELDIEAHVHDFWTPQPVRNACVYYFRRIMHNWPDEQCLRILKHNVDAMGPDSRLLIADIVVPDRVQNIDTYCYYIDLTMMTFAGKERSEVDWRTLFDELGLELVKIWKAEVGTQAVIEGRLSAEPRGEVER